MFSFFNSQFSSAFLFLLPFSYYLQQYIFVFILTLISTNSSLLFIYFPASALRLSFPACCCCSRCNNSERQYLPDSEQQPLLGLFSVPPLQLFLTAPHKFIIQSRIGKNLISLVFFCFLFISILDNAEAIPYDNDKSTLLR